MAKLRRRLQKQDKTHKTAAAKIHLLPSGHASKGEAKRNMMPEIRKEGSEPSIASALPCSSARGRKMIKSPTVICNTAKLSRTGMSADRSAAELIVPATAQPTRLKPNNMSGNFSS